MSDCIYSRNEVCDMLGISVFTMNTWYRWQKKQLDNGFVDKEYLPKPERQSGLKGQPLRWSMEMIGELRDFKSGIIKGRNGIYGIYSNPKKH